MGDSDDIEFRDLADLEGVELAGRFRLAKMLGQGGYGAVFEAEQTSVRRRCAVKVLVPHVAADPRNTERFKREARATSQLAHPNTIVIYDFGLDEQRKLLFLAMEFIEGESLREMIRREGTLDLTRTLWIAHQMARSLQDAHDRGLVHRDVKPHNVMITERGGDPNFVKVIDFGIAKFLDSRSVRESMPQVTATGMVIGTPSYMAPEQVRNATLDGRTDQYALATCIYQMLTGRTVFVGESPVDIATKQLSRKPLPLRSLNPSLEVPREFERTLLRALSKEPEERFDSVRTFAEQLFEASDVSPPFSLDTGEERRVDPSEAPTESLDFEPPVGTDPTLSLPENVDPTAATAALPAISDADGEAASETDEERAETEVPHTEEPNESAETSDSVAGPVQTPMLGSRVPVQLQGDATPSDDVPGNTLAVNVDEAPTDEEDWTLGERPAMGATQTRRQPTASRRRAGVLALVGMAVAVVVGVLLVAFAVDTERSDAAGEREVASAGPDRLESNSPAPLPEADKTEPDETEPDETAEPEEPAADDSRLRNPPSRRAVVGQTSNGAETPPAEDTRLQDAPAAAEDSEEHKKQNPASPDEPQADASGTDDAEADEPEPATLVVTIVPWGELWIDGRKRGDTGRSRVSLPPGRHRIELRQNGAPRASKTVDVGPGESKMIELIAR